jgi:hypothetical protein
MGIFEDFFLDFGREGDRFTNMVNNATFNPFNITCDSRYQNTQPLPNMVSLFAKELNDLCHRLNVLNFGRQKIQMMVKGYVFNLVESYYKNAGYVPKNALDQILEQVYDAMQQTDFKSAFSSLDDFKYHNYYGFLNR